MSFTVPMPPKELSPNSRSQWGKIKAKGPYREEVFWLAKEALQKGQIYLPDTPLVGIRIVCYPRTAIQPDDDNVIASFKHGRDAIASVLGIDDRRMRYLPLLYGPKTKGGALVISICELTERDLVAE